MNVEGDAPLSPARHVTASHRMKLLPVEFVPTIDDVICGRGKKCYSHVGNDRFRERVHTMLALYKQARSKLDKSKVLNMVVEQVRQNSPGGGFVKQDESGRWYEVGDFLAREKTSQTFRDALHESYKSSSVAKKKRRQQEVTRTSTVDQMNKIPRSSIDIAQKIKSMSLEMKNSAKNQVYTQSQTNADIMAGIQQASRDLRRDMMENFQQQHHHQQQQQNFGGFGNSAPQVPFQLEFEPEDGGAMGMAGGHHPGVPARSQSFQLGGARGIRGTGGVGRSLSGNLEMYNNSFPTNSGTLPPPQAFMSASMGDMQFRMGQSSSSAGDFSMADDDESNMCHSVPSINFDAEDLHIDESEQRLHRSAPNLGFYAPSDLMGGPVNVPSSIEFQMGRQQPAFLQNQQPNQMPAVDGIVSQLETLAQLRMEDDDNPFEPLPIDQQQQQQQQNQRQLPQQPPFSS